MQVGGPPEPRGVIVKLRNRSKFSTYRGSDGARLLVIEPGQVAEVSNARGEKLLDDFPDWFELVVPEAPPAKKKNAKE